MSKSRVPPSAASHITRAPLADSGPIVIGVDIGHQYTKAAFSVPAQKAAFLKSNGSHTEVELIQLSKSGSYILPTVVPSPDPDEEFGQWFKLKALSTPPSAGENDTNQGISHKRATDLLGRFLKGLLPQIVDYYNRIQTMHYRYLPPWKEARVEFVFSVPSIVGKDGASILTEAARNAGFHSTDGKHHVLDIVLTEAEAAAVAATRSYGPSLGAGSTMLVLDVGGGTSDVSVMTRGDDAEWELDTNVMKPVSSDKLGGSYVADGIRTNIQRHLERLTWLQSDWNAERVAGSISNHMVHAHAMSNRKHMILALPGLETTATTQNVPCDDGMRVEGPELIIDRAVFHKHIDAQLFGPGGESSGAGGIVQQVSTMRDDLWLRNPFNSRSYASKHGNGKDVAIGPGTLDVVVFCGGFCLSTHVQTRIKTALQIIPEELKNIGVADVTRGTIFHSPSDGQFYVCKGLVLARIRELNAKPKKSLKTWFNQLFE